MQHQQQQTPPHHQYHPYLPPPHHRLHQQNVINDNNQDQTGSSSNNVDSYGGATTTAAAAPIIAPLPLGVSPSYHIATTAITQFYQFTENINLIARTNHSTVHKVYSHLYNREVAVKIIDKRAIPANIVEKFLTRELEITRIVQHPHLVRCLHIIQPHQTKVAIISEFYSGGTLLQYILNRIQVDEADVARIFRQLCEAVYCLHHKLGVVHRDIKMENILLDKNGDVKLADFGFARYISQAQTSTSYCGTKPYSAPQLVQQKPYNPYAADWYACGVVLYTMLCGKWPHDPNTKCVFPLEYPKEINFDARELINTLMNPDEAQRGGYYDIVNSEWMKKLTNGKWTFTDDLFVYDIQSPLV